MSTYTSHPIVMGTKIFDKGMMTLQYAFCWTWSVKSSTNRSCTG